jgi:hypothetical protein
MLGQNLVIWQQLNGRLPGIITPGPGISKPQLWKEMDRRLFWSAIANGDLDLEIFGERTAREDIKVTLLVEGIGIDQLELRIRLRGGGSLTSQS